MEDDKVDAGGGVELEDEVKVTEGGIVDGAERVSRGVVIGVGVGPPATRVMILGSIKDSSLLITNRGCCFNKTSFSLGDLWMLDGILTRRRGITDAPANKKSVNKQKRRAWSCMSNRERVY